MTQKFRTAIEARNVADVVLKQLRECRYNPDLMLYFRNIEKMIGNLSALEVQARQSHKYHKVEDYIKEIEQAFDYLEKMILISKLTE